MNHELDYVLYCSECGSSDVEVRAWVKANTEEVNDDCRPDDIEDCWCCDCEENTRLCTLRELWHRFSDISVNNEDEIEKSFLGFDAGTSKFDVWSWFDERCPNNLHDDLLYPKNE